VGGFVAFVPRDGTAHECCDLLARAKSYLQYPNSDKDNSRIALDWSIASSFPRCNGSGLPIAVDPASGSWLAVQGSCFHRSGNNQPAYLLQRYLNIGAEQLALELNGFFAVIVGNANTRVTQVITDVVGSLHFYHRQLRSSIGLSTSSRLLAQLETVNLDPVGCQEFLATGVIYEDRTFYKEVRKLPPASITTFCDGHQNGQCRYWDPGGLEPESLSPEVGAEKLWEELKSAVASINRQHSSIVCDLTGGYDSRAVAAGFLAGEKKFATVVSGPRESPDVIVSSGLAEIFHLLHIHYPPSSNPISLDEIRCALRLTDGECDLSEYIHVARIHRNLSLHFAVSINGSFGELARGYWWELLFPATGKRHKLDAARLAQRRYAVGPLTQVVQAQWGLDLVEHFRGIVDRSLTGLESFPNTFQMDMTYLRMRMQCWQGRLASSTDRIWPCLSPFIFRQILETILQTRFAARERSLLIRTMLAKHNPPLAAYPLEHGYPAVPATWKTIGKFWPLAPYYGNKVVRKVKQRLHMDNGTMSPNPHGQLWPADEVKAVLDPSKMKSLAIVDPARVPSLLSRMNTEGVPAGSPLSRLLSLELALSTL
jgi:hypothetical protein